MPIYEYKCTEGHVFEVMQRISEDPVATCEVCDAPVQRVFHPVAVHFKGSGFYNTDYGTRKRAREKESSGSGSSDGGSSDSKSSDFKGGDTAKTTADASTASSSAPSTAKSSAKSD